jgi:8-oxo-dGTP diphosphatase
MSEIIVTCAVFSRRGRVLLARRKAGKSNAGLWEFPGGKLEPGELETDCLRREIQEELGADSKIGAFMLESLVEPSPAGGAPERASGGTRILLRAYRARLLGDILVLNDHSALAWALPGELSEFCLCPADLPIARALAQDLSTAEKGA